MDLFITPGFSKLVISTQSFLDSQPITAADAMARLANPRETIINYSEHDSILAFILSACGYTA